VRVVIVARDVREWAAWGGGDSDVYVLTHKCAPPGDWAAIGSLVQDLYLVRAGLAADAYAADVNERLSNSTADDETRSLLCLCADALADHGTSGQPFAKCLRDRGF
jgi:hypothetical protein